MKKIIILLLVMLSMGAFAQNTNVDISSGTTRIFGGMISSNNAYGEMYLSEADTISTATTAWYSVSKWTVGDTLGVALTSDTGLVVKQNGVYIFLVSPSFSHAGSNVLIHYGGFVNGVLETPLQSERTIGTTPSQFGASSLSGIITITDAPDTVQLKVNADKTGNLISNHTNLTMIKIN